jgi:putative ABC transport system permease protein
MYAILSGIALALRAIRRNALRAALTVLGILIGVTAVIVVTGLGTGARQSVGKQIEAIGSNFIIVFPENGSVSGARKAAGVRLTEEDAKAIAREAPSVKAVAPVLRVRGQAVAEGRNWSTSIVGSTRDFLTVRSWGLAKGTMWTQSDEATKSKVCILGKTAKERLFGPVDAVGRSMRIGRYAYTIVGILAEKGEAPFGGDQDDMVLMPIGSMRARIMRTPPGFVGAIMLSATSAETTERAVTQLDALLRQRHKLDEGKAADFRVQTQKEFQAIQGAIYGVLTLLLVVIAAVSLVVGGIGVMNIMLVSVTERTREIGVRMAIGARSWDIQTQFLAEAVCLAFMGGLLGVLLGTAANGAIANALGWTMQVDGLAVSASLGVSALIGIGFGYVPARRAAELDPIAALRTE